MAILLADIGNTSVTLGLARGSRIVNTRRVKTCEGSVKALQVAMCETLGEVTATGAAFCSVAPGLSATCARAMKRATGVLPLEVTHGLELGVRIDYPDPASIGPDRLANSAAAVARYGCPVIVADFGTALTFDIISRDRAYVGGIITPGLPLMADYFAEKTALLPHIDLKGGRGVVGHSTESAMRIGAKLGYRGIVREVVQELQAQPGLTGATLCATGGYARWVLANLDIPFEFDNSLTLDGVRRIYELNQ